MEGGGREEGERRGRVRRGAEGMGRELQRVGSRECQWVKGDPLTTSLRSFVSGPRHWIFK